jgi:hypothetical protein
VAKKPETLFKEKVQKDLKKLPNTWCEKIQQVCIRGTPDLLCCIAGKFVAIELKASSSEVPDALQDHKLQSIANADGMALVVNPENWTETYIVLETLARTGRVIRLL